MIIAAAHEDASASVANIGQVQPENFSGAQASVEHQQYQAAIAEIARGGQ